MAFSKRIVRFCVGWLAAACLLCTAAAAAPLDRWRDCGVLTVSCGLSAPDAPLNRGEMAVLLSQLLGLTGEAENCFSDLSASRGDAVAVLRCVKAGILQGSGGRFRPDDPVSREEAIAMLCRALQIQPLPGVVPAFADGGQVSDWAAGYAAAMSSQGILSGQSGDLLRPADPMTPAEAAALLDRTISAYAGEPGATVAGRPGGLTMVAAANVTVTGRSRQVLVTCDAAGCVRVAGAVGTLLVPENTAVLLLPGAEVRRAVLPAGSRLVVSAGASILQVQAEGDGVRISGSGSVARVDAAGCGTVVETYGTIVQAGPSARGTVAGGQAVSPGRTVTTASAPQGGSGGTAAQEDPEEPGAPEDPEEPPDLPDEEPEEPEDPRYFLQLAPAEYGAISALEAGPFPEWPEQLAIRFTPDAGYALAQATMTSPDGTVEDITREVLRSGDDKPAGQFLMYTVEQRQEGVYTFSARFVRGVRVYTAEALQSAMEQCASDETVFLGGDIDLDGQMGRAYGQLVTSFTGTLDGCGYRLLADRQYNGYLMRHNRGPVTIRNLEIVQNRCFLSLIATANPNGTAPCDILLEDITACSAEDTQVCLAEEDASFIGQVVQGGPDTEIVFRSCVNDADLVLTGGQDAHTGLFIGGAVGQGAQPGLFGETIPAVPYEGTLTFDDCRNRGTFTGSHLGFFVGSDQSAVDSDRIVVTRCQNTGMLLAGSSAGWFADNTGSGAFDRANAAVEASQAVYQRGVLQVLN